MLQKVNSKEKLKIYTQVAVKNLMIFYSFAEQYKMFELFNP